MPGPVPYLIFAVEDNLAAVTGNACVFHDLFFRVLLRPLIFMIRPPFERQPQSLLLLGSQRSAHSSEHPANSQCNNGGRIGLGFDRSWRLDKLCRLSMLIDAAFGEFGQQFVGLLFLSQSSIE